MTERSWCPSLSPQPGAAALSELKAAGIFAPLERAGGDAVSAKRDASVAANNSVSATEVAAALTTAFQRRFHKFDAALVSSKVNRSLWPRVPHNTDDAVGSDDSLVSPDTAVCLGVSTIGPTPINAPGIALPSDTVGDFVSLLARRAAECPDTVVGDTVKGIIAFPPSETVTALSDVVESVASSKSVVEELRSLTIAGASAAKADTTLARLVTAAKKLESFTVTSSNVTNTVVPLLDAVKASEVRHLSLAGSQLGFGSVDLDREGLTSSFCDVAKVSKFLTSLNVADANTDTDFIVALLSAFAESDTKVLPEELGEDPEEVTRWTLEGRVSTALFLGRRNGAREDQDAEDSEADGGDEDDGEDEEDADEEEDEAEEEEEEEEEEADGEGEGADGGDEDDADDGEVDGDEEDEENEEAEMLKKGKAEKQRLLREKKEQREKLKRIKKELKLLVRAEAQERAKLLQAYCQAAEAVVTVNNGPIVNRRAEERQKKKEEYCTRRSGWSHLESVVLHGNPVGDRGCLQLARVLREEVPLTEEEVTQRKEAADATRDGFGEELGAGRAAVLHAEQKAWRALLRLAQRESPVPPVAPRSTSFSAAVSDPDEEDEYAMEAPPVLLTNVERRSGGNRDGELTGDASDDGDEAGSDGEGAGADGLSPEEQKEWQDWVVQSLPQIPVAPVKKGMGTVRFVDVGSCGIGRKGLRALATVLKTNKVLETLRLRHNLVGSAVIAKKGAPQEEAAAVSGEFAEFAAMLSVNSGLRHLDLSYCRLTTGDVRAIAEALQQNASLVTLALEGNQLSVDELYQQQRHAHSYLYELWMSAARPGSAVQGLSLDHNEIAACLWPEEVAALAAVCGQLSFLSLSHVGLRQRHLQAWSAALPATDASHCPTVRTLCLSRNEFVCEADGAVLGELLQRFKALETLSLEEHPLLGSAGVAAALEHVPATLRHLDCSATGLTTPLLGAAQNAVLPPAAVAQLTHLLLSDVEAPGVAAVGEWVDFIKACTPHHLRCLSLWSRGMAGKEGELVPLFLDLAQACPALTYVDGGFQPQLHAAGTARASFLEMERLLLPRRMQSAVESHTA